MTQNLVVGTAGHIDHGKSSLVEALTGVHPDRLHEERERGITIDIGFANLKLADTCQIAFIDVPGHERFIKNMLAGVGGIDAVLLVIAANESIKPQTREHFDICRLLRIPSGIVAVTKADLVDPELLELVRLEIDQFLQGTFLGSAQIIPVSSRTGLGLGELRKALFNLSLSVRSRNLKSAFRLPVDRCFTLQGFGTVVTGTLVSGVLQKDDEVMLYPDGRKGRVRGLQVHSKTVRRAEAGQRTAVNLTNLEVGQIRRGMELSVPNRFRPVSIFSGKAEVLSSSPISLNRTTRVRLHLGAAEAIGTIRPLGQQAIHAGESGFVRLVVRRPLLVLPGDRFVFRRISPMVTLGGGVVLDIRPEKLPIGRTISYLERVSSLNIAELLVSHTARNELKGLDENEALSLSAIGRSEIREVARKLTESGNLRMVSEVPLLLVEAQCFAQLLGRLTDILAAFHTRHPLLQGMPKEQLASLFGKCCDPIILRDALTQLARQGVININGDLVCLAGRSITLCSAETAAKKKIESIFLTAEWCVPELDAVLETVAIPREQAQQIVSLLIKEKVLVKVSEGLIFHSECIKRLKNLVASQGSRNRMIRVTDFKQLTGLSRKYAIPLLEYLDRERVTRRMGDSRIIL